MRAKQSAISTPRASDELRTHLTLIGRLPRPGRHRRTSPLIKAVIEFFDDPDNHDLVLRDPLEWWFKDALERFEHQAMLRHYTIDTVRRAFWVARMEARKTKL